MPSTMPRHTAERHRLLPETTTGHAKADLRKAETAEKGGWREAIGQVIASVKGTQSLKEFAAALGREERQVARWIDGTERPQLDVLFAVETFRQPLIVALAQMAGAGVEVETVVKIRRAV